MERFQQPAKHAAFGRRRFVREAEIASQRVTAVKAADWPCGRPSSNCSQRCTSNNGPITPPPAAAANRPRLASSPHRRRAR